ncbi:hypothetical protein [Helicobacter cetorum]|uniref:hypothetical protein n=1 Tax=Helicobacter cetorum TaxID=138563 RepID=UPI000CF01EB4|nr:hypothetical protein [Helicobacter cetorum]
MLKHYYCGDKNDLQETKHFTYSIKDKSRLIDLVGKTSIFESFELIKRASFVVENDLGLANATIALDCKKPVFVISNGSQYKGFMPYPKEMAPNLHVIFHMLIEKYQELALHDLDYEEVLVADLYYFVGASLHKIDGIESKRVFKHIISNLL